MGYHGDEALDCESMDEADCKATMQCRPLAGSRKHETSDCMVSDYLGCMPVFHGCGNSWTAATSPDGVCYEFATTCVPEGWPSGGSGGRCYDTSLAQCGGS
jgi:hypothetical protein